MSPRFDPATTRRRFVQFLAGSPLLTHPGVPALAQNTSTPSRLADSMVWPPRDLDNLISDPKEALGSTSNTVASLAMVSRPKRSQPCRGRYADAGRSGGAFQLSTRHAASSSSVKFRRSVAAPMGQRPFLIRLRRRLPRGQEQIVRRRGEDLARFSLVSTLPPLS